MSDKKPSDISRAIAEVGDRAARRTFLRAAAAGAGAALMGGSLTACGGGGDAGAAGHAVALGAKPPKTKMDTPTITCGASTQASINIVVTAGATGAPAGFSIQWMTCDAFAAGTSVTNSDGSVTVISLPNQWPSDSDAAAAAGLLCKGSFSGNANLSRYNLGAGESVTVNVGEFLFDEGASTNCAGALTCGTCYVFRAFAHANSTLMRSDFTGNLTCYTLDCTESGGNCTFTQGYWKTHGPIPSGNNTNVWPVVSMTLGTVLYTDFQMQSIFDTPATGNGLIALAHQLMAAKLNIANGADASAIQASIDAADALIGALVVPPVGSGFLAPSAASALITALTNYNEGATGPGHCR